MSDILKLQDLLKSLPSEQTPAEKRMALFDANGVMSMSMIRDLLYKNIADIESPGTILTLKEYIEKYIQGKRPPMMIGNSVYATAKMYYLQLTSSIRLNLQSYCALITKMPESTINTQWIQLSFVLFPHSPLREYDIYRAIPDRFQPQQPNHKNKEIGNGRRSALTKEKPDLWRCRVQSSLSPANKGIWFYTTNLIN